MKFSRCVWDLSLCAPSRTTMLTGLRWQRHGVYTNGLATNNPNDGSAAPFNFGPTTGQPFTVFTTLAANYTSGDPTVTLAPTAEPIMLTAGTGLPGGKISFDGTTNLTCSSATPLFTSTTGNQVVNVTGSVSSQPAGTNVQLQAYFPQSLFMAPGSPGYVDATWDYSKSWPWWLKQVGYKTVWIGKWSNGFPWLKGDLYVPSVGGVRILDRYYLVLDDSAIGNQLSGSTSNAFVTGKPYSTGTSPNNAASPNSAGTDHSGHNEANYLGGSAAAGSAGGPLVFNDQGAVPLTTVSTGVDKWTSATSATAPFAPQTITAATFGGTGNLTITATVPSSGQLLVNTKITVSGATGTWASINGVWTVASQPDSTHVTFVVNVAPTGSYTASSATIGDGYVGTAGYVNRQASPATAYLTDHYSHKKAQWFAGTDGSGVPVTTPFAMEIAVRGDHKNWCPAMRHWCVTPAGTPGLQVGTLDHALAGAATTLSWTSEPSLTGRSTANGTYVMIGAETCQVTAGIGTGTWTLTRDVLSDVENALLQTGGTSPTWAIGTPVLLLSSSTSADTGDDPSFNSTSTGTSPFWQALLNANNSGTTGAAGKQMSAVECVTARHDRIIKAKTGMSVDELIYDTQTYCAATFTNPTVVIVISDNGWEYGGHAQAKGKITPYKLAGEAPIFICWPTGTAAKYPYFSTRPNIVVIITDDDDSESLASGYPILTANAAAGRTESNCLASNLDVAATIADLAGAVPPVALDGSSLAPIASSALTGGTVRSFAAFSLRQSQENGFPGFQGIQTLTEKDWVWPAFTVPSTALESGLTSAQVARGTYTTWEEGYNLTSDSDEQTNSVTQGGYTGSGSLAQNRLDALRQMRNASALLVPNI